MKTFLLFFFIGFFQLLQAQNNIDVLHYKYELELSDASNTIKGKATIQFISLAQLSSLGLDLVNSMQTLSVSQGNSNLIFENSGNKLLIHFPKTLQKGEHNEITIRYQGIPKDGLIIAKNKFGDRTFFADNWPNRAHNWIPCVDRPDDKASFEFIVSAPSQYKIISNGIKVEEKDLGNGNALTHWKEDTPLPTKVMVIGAAKFAVKQYEDSPPNIPVSAWVYQQDSARGFRDFSAAPEILKFYSGYIGPYPYEKLANVESKTVFGGMENASAIFYTEDSVTGRSAIEDLLAHEIAHQWFGDMASEKSFAHLWLSEGFATYFTDLYWQHKYGDDAFKKRLANEKNQVIFFSRLTNHPVVDSLSAYMDLLNPNSYQKGAWVLHMLRSEVGDPVFHKIIQTYYEHYKGSNADTRDFEAIAEKVSGKDLKWFFNQWLYRPGIPKLKFTKRLSGKGVELRIDQLQNDTYELKLVIGIETETAKEKHFIFPIRDKTQSVFLTKDRTARITIDPEMTLLYEEVK